MNEKIKKAEGKMTKSVDRLKGEFAAIRAGRANPAVLDKAMVCLLYTSDAADE